MKTDVTVLGGGPGGLAAALWARRYGFKTVLVEKESVGGVCLHRGCIPTKSLIADAASLSEGLSREEKERRFAQMLQKKDQIVTRLYQGALATLQKEGVHLLQGEGRIVHDHGVLVKGETIETEFILIATGSRPRALSGIPFDGEKILSSDDLLKLAKIPESLLIVGGGPTGCEFASLFHLLGSSVTLLEATPFLLPGYDEEISEALRNIFVRQGIAVQLNEKVISLRRDGHQVLMATVSGKTWVSERVLVSIGRLPNSRELGLETLNIPFENDFISVDRAMRTAVPSIFAVGDVTGKWALAHVASHQGRVAVGNMAGSGQTMEEVAIPECVFTIPEVAKVGWTEKMAREKGKIISIGRSPFIASAKAQILEQKEGFVKLVGERDSGKLLGAHLLGPHVTELLGELTLALRMGATVGEIRDTIHPHPTLSETIEEAACAFSNVASKAH